MVGIVGYRWTVTHVVDSDGMIAVPASLHAEIGFTEDGYVHGNDSVNALQGRYTPTAGGYSVRDGGSTLVGYVGADPIRTRTIAAVDAMFLRIGRPGELSPSLVAVDLSLENDTLTLRHGDVALTLVKPGS